MRENVFDELEVTGLIYELIIGDQQKIKKLRLALNEKIHTCAQTCLHSINSQPRIMKTDTQTTNLPLENNLFASRQRRQKG